MLLIDPAWDKQVAQLIAYMKPRYLQAITTKGQSLTFKRRQKKKVIRGPNAGTWK